MSKSTWTRRLALTAATATLAGGVALAPATAMAATTSGTALAGDHGPGFGHDRDCHQKVVYIKNFKWVKEVRWTKIVKWDHGHKKVIWIKQVRWVKKPCFTKKVSWNCDDDRWGGHRGGDRGGPDYDHDGFDDFPHDPHRR